MNVPPKRWNIPFSAPWISLCIWSRWSTSNRYLSVFSGHGQLFYANCIYLLLIRRSCRYWWILNNSTQYGMFSVLFIKDIAEYQGYKQATNRICMYFIVIFIGRSTMWKYDTFHWSTSLNNCLSILFFTQHLWRWKAYVLCTIKCYMLY